MLTFDLIENVKIIDSIKNIIIDYAKLLIKLNTINFSKN